MAVKATKRKKKRPAPDALTQKNQEYFHVYTFSTSKNGMPDFDRETKLSRMAQQYGGVCTGSGTDLETKQRDQSFAFSTIDKAVEFMKEAVQRKLVKAEVTCQHWILDWRRAGSYKLAHYRTLLKHKSPG